MGTKIVVITQQKRLKYQVLIEMFNNFIQVVPTFSEQECKLIIAEAEHQGKTRDIWEQATVYDSDGFSDLESDIRSNERLAIDDQFVVFPMVVERLNEAYQLYSRYLLASMPKEQLRMPMPMAPGSKSQMEVVGLLRYKDGQKYDWHSDASYRVEDESHDRVISVVTYLNSDFEGGKTEFIDGARKPKPGNSLFFPSNWVFAHHAQPVTSGTKYALVTWYRITDA